MKIMHMEVTPFVMSQEDPEWHFALGGAAQHRNVIVKLIADNGLVGLGFAAAPAHQGCTQNGVKAALEKYAPCLTGQDPFSTEKISATLSRTLQGNNCAQAAIDIALHDLQAKALGLPLYALLGGLVREEIPVIRILSLKEPTQMAVNALKLVEQGYAYIKVKLDGDAAKDLARVKAIRKAVGDSVHLTVDANQSYAPKVAIATLKRMQEYGIELCEQPVRAEDWQGLAEVTRSVDCIVEAHESAETLHQIFSLVKDKVVDSINIKIGQIGGLDNAKTAAAFCKVGNVSCRIATTGASRIISAAAMHFVAATENVSYACELGEFARLLDDPVEGFEVQGGKIKVPSGIGLGVALRS